MKRRSLSFDTGELKILPGQWAQITERVSRAISPEQLLVSAPCDWAIHGISVDLLPVIRGPLSGAALADAESLAPIGRLRRGQRLSLVVSYRGRARRGKSFSASVVGHQ
jgi:hypothetical protein